MKTIKKYLKKEDKTALNMLKKPVYWGVADSSRYRPLSLWKSMSLLIDTPALVSARNADDKNHNKALDIMIRALKGEFGKLYVSDYVFDEAVTIAYVRTGNKKFVHDIGIYAKTKPIIFLFIEPLDFERSWELYLQFQDKNFSFADCTNIALMERYGIDTLFTYRTG